MTTLKSYLNQFEDNLQQLDIDYVRGILEVCEDEIARREKEWQENGQCAECGTTLVQDRDCDSETGYNEVNHDYCPNCK